MRPPTAPGALARAGALTLHRGPGDRYSVRSWDADRGCFGRRPLGVFPTWEGALEAFMAYADATTGYDEEARCL